MLVKHELRYNYSNRNYTYSRRQPSCKGQVSTIGGFFKNWNILESSRRVQTSTRERFPIICDFLCPKNDQYFFQKFIHFFIVLALPA